MKLKTKTLPIFLFTFLATMPTFFLNSCATDPSLQWEITTSSNTLDSFQKQIIISSNLSVSWNYDSNYELYATFDKTSTSLTITYEASVDSSTTWTINAKYKKSTKPVNLVVNIFNVDFNQYWDYINQRTFSLFSLVGQTGVWGTGWIYNKVSDLEDDFRYYLLTNWHVAQGFMDQGMTQLSYCSNIFKDNSIAVGDYVNFDNYTLLDENALDDYRPIFNSIDPTITNQSYIIDSFMIEVDFGSSFNTTLQSSLLDLNQYYLANEKHVNQFSSTISEFGAQQYFIGGYPANTSIPGNPVANWTYDKLQLKDQKSFDPKQNQKWYNTSTVWKSQNYNVSGSFYVFEDNQAGGLSGGSSGSMVINNNFEIIGQYWGGSTSSNGIWNGSCLLFATDDTASWVSYNYSFLEYWDMLIGN